ncbi:biotin-dependent carboxyltransferase family protein [Arcobacter roscoffensis]|uniref:Biotin-dependent carboxyltransferase family protein n=1 Tax=Arcobacter roscoffensis TaxID=2961520 RepID=A0ABY5EA26_9BACT|nr:biotin-dependent carboxyltransferase family protein [Arcobacter roscoffensis]UTJ07568.1 biotin-dependent carboxyltransferase family protein [Arcobacter roscoffensis]
MSLEIINSPIFATIQDKGRFGFNSIGVTNSGVMDEYAYLIANKLLENSEDENIIEIAFSNVEFKALKDIKVALTGAKCEFFINNTLYPTWQTYSVKAGDIIKVGKIEEGARVYFGVKGGFDIKKEFGSNSTTLKEKLGGINADRLQKGQILESKKINEFYNIRLKEKFVPKYEDTLELRVILSYQDEFFYKEEIAKFFSSIYTVSNEFNRMGCKLQGEPVSCSIDGIISEGIGFGSIQIPSDGQPIILLKDRQTIGGYPKIGSVLSIDCFKLAQAKPKTKIKFKPIEIKKAQDIVKKFYSSLR